MHKSITRIKTKGGTLLRLTEAMHELPGVHLTLRVHLHKIFKHLTTIH